MSRLWTCLPPSYGRRFIHGRIVSGILVIFGTLLLTSCGFSFGGSNSASPPPSRAKNSSNPALETPPIIGDRPGASTQDVTEQTTLGSAPGSAAQPNFQGASGLNNQLFSEKIKGEEQRLDRLENVVQSLRNDFDEMAPAITRLVGVEGDLQELIEQLEMLLGEEQNSASPAPAVETAQIGPYPPAASPPQPAPNAPPVPLEPNTSQPPPAPASVAHLNDGPTPSQPQPVMGIKPSTPNPATIAVAANLPSQTVADIRVGEHPDKTRIVLDINGNTAYSFDLDNGEKLLIIELPKVSWSAPQEGLYNRSPLLQSYRIDPMDGEGTRLIVSLRKTAKVSYDRKIDGKIKGQQRIILDLMSGG